MEPDDLLCSRNARPGKALVGRAQWKINQAPFPEKIASELGGCGARACGAFFVPGARALRRASLDGRSQKLPAHPCMAEH